MNWPAWCAGLLIPVVMITYHSVRTADEHGRLATLEACLGPADLMPPEPADGSPDPCWQVRQLQRQISETCDLAGSSLALADRVDGAYKRVTMYCSEVERRRLARMRPESWLGRMIAYLSSPWGKPVDNSEDVGEVRDGP